MQSSFSLSFLEELGPKFTDQDVEATWDDRTFPLICTGDFKENWRVIPDSEGIFVTSSGTRCIVKPQPQHESSCKVLLCENGTKRNQVIPYEAIIFAKVLYQMSLNSATPGSPDTKLLGQVERRQFIDNFVIKLPRRWRNIITQCDPHQYEENPARRPQSVESGLYSPLADPKNIRLLKLLPSVDRSEPIKCIIEEADLSKGPEYEALSYVWGNPSPQRTVILNGRSFPVGENLEAALRQLRPCGTQQTHRTIWIDAICINQRDVQERTQQVSQMDTVYRGAARVVIWLGRESNTSARVFRDLEFAKKDFSLFNEHEYLELSLFPLQTVEYCAECNGIPKSGSLEQFSRHQKEVRNLQIHERAQEHLRRTQNPKITSQRWKNAHIDLIEATIKLLERPWWDRVWVLQEVILAKKAILCCGPKSVDWTFFQAMLYTLIRQAKRSRIHQSSSLSRDARAGKAQTILLARAQQTSAFFFLQGASLSPQKTRHFGMANLLSLTSDFDATDARDKVFALVGLLPENSPERLFFEPNYLVNARQLFIQVAKHFLQTTQRLDIVTARPQKPDYYDVPKKYATNFEVPSWVPNWKHMQLWPYNSIWISDFSDFETITSYVKNHKAVGSEPDEVVDNTSASANGPTAPEAEQKGSQLFNASLHEESPFAFDFSASDEILHAHGILVDTIEEIGFPWDLRLLSQSTFRHGHQDESRNKAHELQVSVIERWKGIARVKEEETYPLTQQTRHEAFWRTLFLDRCRYRPQATNLQPSFRRIPPLVGEKEKADLFFKHLGNFPPKDENDETWLIWYLRHEVTEMWNFGKVNLHCANLRFFRTAKGFIGVSHPNVRIGDKVVVVLGAPVPFVLREYPEGHVVMGQRYVHTPKHFSVMPLWP